jgi:hypothetical protein
MTRIIYSASTPGGAVAYQSEHCEIAYKHSLAGVTTEELAYILREPLGTVVEWISTIPEFRDAMRRGRNGADAVVEQSLVRMLDGYDERVVTQDGEPTIVRHIKRHPPKRTSLVHL